MRSRRGACEYEEELDRDDGEQELQAAQGEVRGEGADLLAWLGLGLGLGLGFRGQG